MTAKRILSLISILLGLALPVYARAALTVTPLTWNVVGLDSNNPAVGPYIFPVGVRVCNTGPSTVDGVTADFAWDDGLDLYTGDPYINMRAGSLSSLDLGSISSGSCYDAYFQVQITQDAAAFDQSRAYHVTATGTDSSSGATVTGTSPQPRQLYVEHLISQDRNGFTDLRVDGVSVAAGGSLNFMVGSTYTIEVDGYTATQGYNQLETFLNLPNTIFQVLSVSTTYSANTSPYVSNPSNKLYADACLWENDPVSPNYNSCVGGDYKAGGTVTTTYTIKIIAGAGTSTSLTGLFYDFSGSSFHYDNDFSSFAWTVNIVNAAITKTFSPKTITPGGTSTVTFTINNPGPQEVTDANFSDTLPGDMTFYNSTVAYTGCGSPSPASLTAGSNAVTFSGITVAGFGTCTISATVTATNTGTDVNTTGDLFINSTTDTGSYGSDTLIVSNLPQPPSSCSNPVTLATWTMPTSGQGSGGPPPPYTTKASDVSIATATSSLTAAGTQSIVAGGVTTNAWNITDAWPNVTGAPAAGTAPYFQFSVDSSKYGGITISTQYDLEAPGDWASNANDHIYIYTSTDNSSYALAGSTVATKGSWQPAVSASASAWGPTTYFRIAADTRGNKATSSVLLDNIIITGCPRPVPPTLSKAFSPVSIPQGTSSALTFTFTNPSGSALTGVSFSDTLPSGLVVATPNGLTGPSCTTGSITGQTITAVAGSTSISMSGATLSAGASCSFSVSVKGNTAGQYTNISGNISSTESGPNTTSSGYGTANLTVVAPPVISKAFGSDTILTGDQTTLSFTIINPNGLITLNGVAFNDTLPAGLTIADSTGPACGGGTLTTTAATGVISLTGGSISAAGSCTFSVTVTGAANGLWTNTTGSVTSTNGGTGNTATANILVKSPSGALTLLKQVTTCDGSGNPTGLWTSSIIVSTGDYVCYRFTVENTGDVPLSGISVTDPVLVPTSPNEVSCSWPAPLPVASQTSDPTATCTTGPVTATSGTTTNTATAHGDYSATTYDSGPSSATYETTGLQITKTFTDSTFSADYGTSYTFGGYGDVLYYKYTVTNTGASDLSFPVTVTDDKTTVSCPATYTGGGSLLPGNGGSITCTASYTVTSSDVLNGYVSNTAFAETAAVDPYPSVTSNTVRANATYSPTLVVLSGFGAYEEDGGVVVWWKTASEINTLGFNLLRLDPVTGEYNAVNSGLLPGILDPHHGGNYSLRDPGALPGNTYTYKLVEVEVSGNMRTYGPFTVFTGYAPAGSDQAMPAGSNYKRTRRANPGSYEAPMSGKHSRKTALKARTALVGDRIKVPVTDDGLYYIDANDIASMLGISSSKASGMIVHNMISVSNRGRQVAYLPAGNGAGLYFYGTHIDSVYTNENIYWLDALKGTVMTTLEGTGPLTQEETGSFLDTAHFEQNMIMWESLFNDPNADYWFWSSLFASSYYTSPPASFTFRPVGLDTGTANGTVTVNLFGGSDTDHDVMVSLNGKQVEGKWSGQKRYAIADTFPLTGGDNTLNVKGLYDGGSSSLVLVESFDVNYPRLYEADGDVLFFRGDGAPTVTVGGFSSPDIMVFDLTDPLMPKLVAATTVGSSSASATTIYSVSLTPASAETPYLAVAGGGIKTASADAVVSSNLSSKNNAADYLVIAPAELVSTAQGLADYRHGQGMRTMVVNVDDIMNEFNYGISSPEAIKAFLSAAYSNWKTAPLYVVLAGDGSADYKNYLGFDRSLVPSRMVPTDYGLAVSDNYLADFNGDHIPEMAIGRLPVADADELQTVIDKIKAHESSLGRSDAILAADMPDSGGDFMTDSENLVDYFLAGFAIHRIYLGDLSASTVTEKRTELVGDLNNGTAFLNYVGHGGPDVLSDGLLSVDDVPSLTNAAALPTMTAMTCIAGNFSDPYADVLSESLLLAPGGGMAGVWAASGLSDDTQAGILDREFYNAVFSGGHTVFGDAVLQALSVYKQQGTIPYMMDIYNILGDPALRLR